MSVCSNLRLVDTPKPRIVEDGDVLLKVTGSTICGSDLHLLHGILVVPLFVVIP